jgi:hypothetical protein
MAGNLKWGNRGVKEHRQLVDKTTGHAQHQDPMGNVGGCAGFALVIGERRLRVGARWQQAPAIRGALVIHHASPESGDGGWTAV